MIQVVADGRIRHGVIESRGGRPRHRWVRHVSARIAHRTTDDEAGRQRTQRAITKWSATTLRRSPSFSGRGASTVSRFQWSISSCRSGPGGCTPTSSLPRGVDGRIARRRRSPRPPGGQFQPAADGSCRCRKRPVRSRTRRSPRFVEVHRRGGNGDELIVDIAVKAPDGGTCIDICSLRYAEAESRSRTGGSPGRRPAHVGARDRVATVGEHADAQPAARPAVQRSRSRAGAMLPALCAIGSPTPATWRPASARHSVSSTSPTPGRGSR